MHMNPQNGEIQINTLRLIYLYQNRLFLSNEDDIKSIADPVQRAQYQSARLMFRNKHKFKRKTDLQ